MAALGILYVATSMIVAAKIPPRAIGLLGLLLIAPAGLAIFENTPGFAAGFIYVLLLIALTALSFRLLLGKRFFSKLIVAPLSTIAKTWFNRKGRKSIKDIWGVKGGK